MSTIRIQSSTRTWSSDTAQVLRVGRDPGNDIVTDDSTVSRAHAELRPTGPGPIADGWEVVDLGSSLGTWVNGQRVERAQLTGTTVVGFGDQGRGFSVTVTVTSTQAQAQAPVGPAAPTQLADPPTLDATIVSGPLLPPPGSHGASTAGGTGPGHPGLLVRRRLDSDLRFPATATVRVGRDPALEVLADDSAVSRLHAVLEPVEGGWRWTDHSTGGSFVDGERISTLLIEEPTEISLGHPTAGYEIEVVPVLAAGQATAAVARRKRRRALAVAGAVVAVVLLVAGSVVLGNVLAGDDAVPVAQGSQDESDTGLDTAELDRAKAASVFLTAIDDSGTPIYTGSGSIISDDGLILTNAHVGKPTAPGQGAAESGDPAYLLVSTTSGSDDVPAEPTYRAEPIVADGYLDLAVLQITADAEGDDVDLDLDLDLPEPLPLGTSSGVRTGDEITALGYPAIGNVAEQLSKPLTITRGVVSTFQADPVIGTERGFIDSDVRLGSGNSGGPSINDAGEMIGINTAVVTANSDSAGAITSGSALIRPIDLAADILEIARRGGDSDYVSPYVDELPTEELPADVVFESAGWVAGGREGDCAGTSTVDDPQVMSVVPGELLYAEYLVRGVPDGTPIGVTLYSLDGAEVIGSLQDTWSFGADRTCIYVPFEAPDGVPGVNGVFVVGPDAEAVVDNPLVYQ